MIPAEKRIILSPPVLLLAERRSKKPDKNSNVKPPLFSCTPALATLKIKKCSKCR
jgi:hypothetical protein